MRYLHRIRLYRAPAAEEGAVQDKDGLPLPGAPGQVLVFEDAADVQDSVRRRGGQEAGPFGVQRDADAYLQQEVLVHQAAVGMQAVVEWQPSEEEGRESTATVVGLRELDGRLLLDWVSREREVPE